LKQQSESKLGVAVDFDPAAEARRICEEQAAALAG